MSYVKELLILFSILAVHLPSVPWLALSPPFNYACEKNLSSVVTTSLELISFCLALLIPFI